MSAVGLSSVPAARVLPPTVLAAIAALGVGLLWRAASFDADALRFASMALIALGATVDLRTRRIPNAITGAAFVLAMVGSSQLGSSAAATVIAPLPFLLLAFIAPGSMGMGDVKLLGAAGALAMLSGLQPLLIGTALLGAALGAVAYARGGRRSTLADGRAIAGGGLLAILL